MGQVPEFNRLERERQPSGRVWTVAFARTLGRNRLLSAATMNAAEQMFFFDAPLAHVVHYEDQLRAARHEQATRRLARARGPHNLVRSLTEPLPLHAAGAE